MTTQVNNPENVELLSAHFARRNEPNQAWKSAVASLLGLPYLRAAYSMSSVGYAAATRGIDISGQANHLSDVNTVKFAGGDPLNYYAQFVGASSQVLYRADGGAANWADIRGTEAYAVAPGLTLGAWVYFGNAAGATETVMGKYYAAAGARSYILYRAAGGAITTTVSIDGTAVTTQASVTSPAASTWYFVAMRFVPSATLDVWVNQEMTTLAAGVPASIADTATDFTVGANVALAGYTNYMTGRQSLGFLCAGALSNTMMFSFYHQTRRAFGV